MGDIDEHIQAVLDWANEKLRDGNEPPWSWYQFMKLREALEVINSGVMQIPNDAVVVKLRGVEKDESPAD